jgi:hypothetical protein
VRPHPKWAHPLWPVAPNGHFEDVAISASLKIKKLALDFDFPTKLLLYFDFHKYLFLNKKW